MTTASQKLLAEIAGIWQQLDPARRQELESYALDLVADQRAGR